MKSVIYLDYNATAPVDPRVVDVMVPYLFERFGNASSAHAYGYDAQAALMQAREHMARLINASPEEIVFTSGGSETDNLAIKGAVFPALRRRPHVIATEIEHPAVLNTLRYLKRRFGVEHTLVPVDSCGRVSAKDIQCALQPETVLISVMHANNEVGTIQPVEEISAIAKAAGVLLHADAAQTAGKIPVDVEALGVDVLTIASHKLYGPKGMGAAFIRRGVHLDPIIHGSGQEHGMRAGTENVASAVGMGEACRIALEELPEEEDRLRALRDHLTGLIQSRIPGSVVNGHPTLRLPNTLNVSLPGVQGHIVLGMSPGIAASTASACHSGSPDPSPVLTAMGIARESAMGALRLSLGRWTTLEDVTRAADMLVEAFRAIAGTEASLA